MESSIMRGGALYRLDRIRWCPTQFQTLIAGEDVRVHVIGCETFASAIASNVTDYRYAGRTDGGEAELTPVELDEELAQRCVQLAASCGRVARSAGVGHRREREGGAA